MTSVPPHGIRVPMLLGGPHAQALHPGLARLGLQPRCITLFRARRTQDVLWAMEEALKCSGLAAVVAELAPNGTGIDLTASRRLVLAAEAGGGIGLLLHQRASMQASAAATRWAITAAPSTDTPSTGAPNIGSTYGGLGAPAFIASLTKNRSGVTGTWRMTWSAHEQTFHNQSVGQSIGTADRDRTPVPVDRAAASGDRPDRAPLRFGTG